MAAAKTAIAALLAMLAALSACAAPRLQPVAEISPPLIQEEVFAWNGPVAGPALFPCREGIAWVDAAGKIVTWNPGARSAGGVWPLPFAVNDPPFYQDHFLVLQSRADDRWLVFDLERMETRFEGSGLQAARVLGVDGEQLVYADGQGLVVRRWREPAGVFRRPAVENRFFNCHFSSEHILVMSDRSLFVFSKGNGSFRQLPLPVQAASPFRCQGEHIYFGSSRHQLVKYAWRRNRLVWKLTLGQNLERQPFVAGSAILIVPQDNMVWCVNGSGSVRWWRPLRSVPQFDPLPMTDHLAAFLLNGEVTFIDFRRRGETVYKLNGRPAGAPLPCGHDLYFFLSDGAGQKLQRLGNRYGLELSMDPQRALFLGEAVRFPVLVHNLPGATLRVVVFDDQGQALMSREFGSAERAEPVWIPPRPGAFRLQANAVAPNRSDETSLLFQVFDPREIFLNLYPFF